jgi:hypothetical protein
MTMQAKNIMPPVLLMSLLTLAGCDKPGDAPQQPKVAATTAQPAPPYTPPTADQLQQMVAPIALFPDKLVGQVLAGATYPAQITAADQWVDQNPSLKGDALQAAEANQPWDVSVKSLTAFPSVLDQMAGNVQWTTALGEAYANDPNDVMNAIQVMRVRAQQAGNLKSSPRLRVSTTLRAAPPPPTYVEQAPSETVVYAGPPVIPPPPQTIVIEPAEPDVVYVPEYNPTVVYGAPVAVYPGWRYREPAYVSSDLVTTGAITFGIGVLVGAAVSHHYHDWGWNSWGVNWGGPGYGGGWHRPAVVYNNNTYVTKSVTVVNNVNNVHVTNNNFRGGPNPTALAARGPLPSAPPRPTGPMSMPHFAPHDAVPGTRSPMAMAQHDFRQQQAPVAMHDNHGAPLPTHAMNDRQRFDAARPNVDAGRGHAAQPPAQMQAQAHAAAPAQDHREMAMHAEQPRPQPERQQMQDARLQAQHEQAAQQRQAQMQRAEAPMQRPPMPQRDTNALDRAQAHAVRQDVQAMHPRPAERPQPQPQPQHQQQTQHMERHEQAAHHENHDKQREHHG